MQLFTIHNAGGNRYSFSFLKKHLNEQVIFQQLELPGRGSRIREDLLASIPEMVDDLFQKISPQAELPFAILGDCMGGLLAYLLAVKLIKSGRPSPQSLIICGTQLPSGLTVSNRSIEYSEEQISLMMLNFGISPELVDNEEFFEIYGPIVLADIKAYNSYYLKDLDLIAVPILLLLKKEELKQSEKAKSWQLRTSFPVKIKHINPHDPQYAESFANIINKSFSAETK